MDHASTVLDWHHNLVREEIPPQWMWPFDEELGFWFKDVERKRRASSTFDADDGDDMIQSDEAVRLRRQWSRAG